MSGIKGESKISPRRVSAKIKQARAIQLRIAGASFRAIKEAVGYNSEQAAYDAVKRALERVVDVPAQELLDLELRRLDDMLRAIWTRVVGRRIGDRELPAELPAVDRALRILARRAALLGLDKKPGHSAEDPLHLQFHHPEEDEALAGLTDDELARFAAVGEALEILTHGTPEGHSDR